MASSALAASMEGGLEPNSQNSAQLKSWSLTLSPRRTERPFIFRSGSPISSSLPFSWQSSTILPKWTTLPVCCASLRTADASRTLPSSQAPVPFVGNGRLRNRSFSHSASKALRALGQDSISLRDNLRAIQHGACQAFLSRCGSFSSGSLSIGSLGTESRKIAGAALPEAAAAASSALYSRIASFFCLAVEFCQSSGCMFGGLVEFLDFRTEPRPGHDSNPSPLVSPEGTTPPCSGDGPVGGCANEWG